jgi:hypothetical protein
MSSTEIASVYYIDGVAVGARGAFMATQLETLEPDEVAHTRMSVYSPETQELPFGYFDLEDNIVSVHAYKVLPEDKKRYVGLSRQGAVHFVRGSTREVRTETLAGAGLRDGNLGGLMTHLREIDGQLWACGQRGQVFRRFGQDDWRHADQGLHVPLNPADYAGRAEELAMKMAEGPMLNCIDGTSAQDVYVVGDQGFMAHHDGRAWRQVALPTDEHLQWVRCQGPDEVWACGFNGTVLVGHARSGFRDVSTVDDNQTWVCLTKFQGRVYLSAEEGLHVYDGQRIAPVKTKLKPELQDAWRVDHAEGVLWSIGVKDLARFDGKRWERIHHPDNEKIGG